MRLTYRSLLAASAVAILAACFDSSRTTMPSSRASLAIVPSFSEGATRAAATLAAAGVDFDNVRIVIVRPPSDTLKDTTIVFGPTTPPLTLELSVVAAPSEALSAGVQYSKGTTVLFSGTAPVKTFSPTAPDASVIPV